MLDPYQAYQVYQYMVDGRTLSYDDAGLIIKTALTEAVAEGKPQFSKLPDDFIKLFKGADIKGQCATEETARKVLGLPPKEERVKLDITPTEEHIVGGVLDFGDDEPKPSLSEAMAIPEPEPEEDEIKYTPGSGYLNFDIEPEDLQSSLIEEEEIKEEEIEAPLNTITYSKGWIQRLIDTFPDEKISILKTRITNNPQHRIEISNKILRIKKAWIKRFASLIVENYPKKITKRNCQDIMMTIKKRYELPKELSNYRTWRFTIKSVRSRLYSFDVNQVCAACHSTNHKHHGYRDELFEGEQYSTRVQPAEYEEREFEDPIPDDYMEVRIPKPYSQKPIAAPSALDGFLNETQPQSDGVQDVSDGSISIENLDQDKIPDHIKQLIDSINKKQQILTAHQSFANEFPSFIDESESQPIKQELNKLKTQLKTQLSIYQSKNKPPQREYETITIPAQNSNNYFYDYAPALRKPQQYGPLKGTITKLEERNFFCHSCSYHNLNEINHFQVYGLLRSKETNLNKLTTIKRVHNGGVIRKIRRIVQKRSGALATTLRGLDKKDLDKALTVRFHSAEPISPRLFRCIDKDTEASLDGLDWNQRMGYEPCESCSDDFCESM